MKLIGLLLAALAGRAAAVVVAHRGDALHSQIRDASSLTLEKLKKSVQWSVKQPFPWEVESEDKEESAYAACLMGGVAVVMAMFYLVNFPREEIRTSTWQCLNMTVSIFCAVLIYGLIKEVATDLFGYVKGQVPMSMDLFLFIFVYILFQATLCVCAKLGQGWGLKAAATLFSHLAGFAAMFLWADLQLEGPFAKNIWMTLLVALASGVVMLVLNFVAHKVREKFISWDGKVTEDEEAWQDAVDDAEQDVLSLATGFALMQAMRFAIAGKAEPFEPDEAPEDIKQWEADALLICSVVSAVLVGGSAVANGRLLPNLTKQSLPWMFMKALPGILSMCMAWSLLFWGEWQIYCLGFKGVRIAGCLCVALLMSFVAVVCVFGLDFLQTLQGDVPASEKTAIKELVLALGLLAGFSWERCFDMGLDTISELHGSYAWLATHLLSCSLLLLVVPGWSKYVLPKAAD